MCTNAKSVNPNAFSKKDIEDEILKVTRTDVETKLQEHVDKVVAEISAVIRDTAMKAATSDSVPHTLTFSIDICRLIPNVLRVMDGKSENPEEITLNEAGEAKNFNEVYNADFCTALQKALTDGTHGFSLKEGCSYTYEAFYKLRKLVGLSTW